MLHGDKAVIKSDVDALMVNKKTLYVLNGDGEAPTEGKRR